MTPTPELRHCFYCGVSLGAHSIAQWLPRLATCDKPECNRALQDEIRAANDKGNEERKS